MQYDKKSLCFITEGTTTEKQPFWEATCYDIWILLNVMSVIQVSGRASIGNLNTLYNNFFSHICFFSNFRSPSHHVPRFLMTCAILRPFAGIQSSASKNQRDAKRYEVTSVLKLGCKEPNKFVWIFSRISGSYVIVLVNTGCFTVLVNTGGLIFFSFAAITQALSHTKHAICRYIQR